jgi:hypothetical protein
MSAPDATASISSDLFTLSPYFSKLNYYKKLWQRIEGSMPALSEYILSDFLSKKWLDNQYDRHFIPSHGKACQLKTPRTSVIQCVFTGISSLLFSTSSADLAMEGLAAISSEIGDG